MKKITYVSMLLLAGISMHSCSSDEQKKVEKKAETKPVLTEPLRYHKALEVIPGLTYDVVSWGRGSSTTGAFIILRSDSTHLKYRTQTGELDGKIVDSWNMDMDSDGNPEIFIQSEGTGEGSYLNMYVYEFGDDGNGNKRDFPSLSSSMKKGYRGGDSLYVKDGRLMREFPVYEEGDNTGKATGGKRVIEYTYRGNTFYPKEIKPEDAAKN